MADDILFVKFVETKCNARFIKVVSSKLSVFSLEKDHSAMQDMLYGKFFRFSLEIHKKNL